jgi:two-component system response regulator (stage 0 sporulation protein A)
MTTQEAPKTTRAAEALEGAIVDHDLYRAISNIFITIGIPANIQGYRYLREAIMITAKKPEIISKITRVLYPSIAKKYNTSPSKVERAIRHAIEVGWGRGRSDEINKVFGIRVYGFHDKPTNSEFIALIADKMLIDGVVAHAI